MLLPSSASGVRDDDEGVASESSYTQVYRGGAEAEARVHEYTKSTDE